METSCIHEITMKILKIRIIIQYVDGYFFLLLELMNLKQIKRQEEKRYKLLMQTKKVK